jgi:hypothetical protein
MYYKKPKLNSLLFKDVLINYLSFAESSVVTCAVAGLIKLRMTEKNNNGSTTSPNAGLESSNKLNANANHKQGIQVIALCPN